MYLNASFKCTLLYFLYRFRNYNLCNFCLVLKCIFSNNTNTIWYINNSGITNILNQCVLNNYKISFFITFYSFASDTKKLEIKWSINLSKYKISNFSPFWSLMLSISSGNLSGNLKSLINTQIIFFFFSKASLISRRNQSSSS